MASLSYQKNPRREKKWSGILLLGGILVCALALRLLRASSDSLWYDELYFIWASKHSLGPMINEVLASGHPLGYFLVEHFWVKLGSGEVWDRLVSLTAGMVTVGLVYLTGKELFSRRAGLLAAALAAVSPFLIWYSADATDYSFLIAASMASFLFLIRSINRGGWTNWGLYVLFTYLALFFHYYAVFLLLAEPPVYFLLRRRGLRPWLLSQGILVLLLIPWTLLNQGASSWVYLTFPDLRSLIGSVGKTWLVLLEGYRQESEGGAAVMELSNLKVVLYPLIYLAFLGLFLLALRRKTVINRKHLALVVFSVVLVLGPATVQVVNSDYVGGRFVAMAAAPLLLLLAGVLATQSRRIVMLAGLSAIAGLLGFTILQQTHSFHHDWRGIMATIRANAGQDDQILCFPLYHCVVAEDFYLHNQIPLRGGILANKQTYIYRKDNMWNGYAGSSMPPDLMNDQELASWLSRDLSGVDRVWLIGGVGSLGYYPSTAGIERNLPPGRRLKKDWRFDPLEVRLYERCGGSEAPDCPAVGGA